MRPVSCSIARRQPEFHGRPSGPQAVAPNALHHLFIGQSQAAWPAARVYAAPGLRKRRKDTVSDGDLDDSPAPGWSGEIDQVVVRGNAITGEVVFFHRKSHTVIFAGLIQHFTPGWFSGWRAMVARWDLMAAPNLPFRKIPHRLSRPARRTRRA
jgi:hypothetical protein